MAEHLSLFYAFNSNGNRGIACGLNNLMKCSDGEPLGSRATAESDLAFAEADDDFFGVVEVAYVLGSI